MLQLLHQKFTPGAQRFKAGSLAKVAAVQLEGIKHREKTPEVRAGVLWVFWSPLAISARSLPDPHNPSHAHSRPHRILAVHTILLQFHFGERARLAAYGDVPIMRPISAEVLEKVSVDDLSRLYEAAFTADPSAFTFRWAERVECRVALQARSVGLHHPTDSIATPAARHLTAPTHPNTQLRRRATRGRGAPTAI